MNLPDVDLVSLAVSVSAVVGALVLLAGTGRGVWLWLRRQRQAAKAHQMNDLIRLAAGHGTARLRLRSFLATGRIRHRPRRADSLLRR